MKARIEGGEKVTIQEIKETLEKQLQLLSERSEKCSLDSELVKLSETMIKIARFLTGDNERQEGFTVRHYHSNQCGGPF